MQEKEYADIHKALEFIFTIYILLWVEQKDFHLSQLSKGLEHDARISKIEQQIYTADNNCGESDNEKGKPGKLSDAHSMHSVTVFNLRCVKNMLEGAPEGQSWAHALRARMNLPDVEFESEIGNQMSSVTFTDDADFLGKILPKEILQMLFCGEKNEISVEQIMDGTYSEEIKSRVLEQVVKANCKAIDGIICKCSCLMKRRGWERSFVAAHKAFFAIMGKEVWAFKHDMQACGIFDNMDKGIAMFIVYALLGAERYELLPSITNKPIEKIFR